MIQNTRKCQAIHLLFEAGCSLSCEKEILRVSLFLHSDKDSYNSSSNLFKTKIASHKRGFNKSFEKLIYFGDENCAGLVDPRKMEIALKRYLFFQVHDNRWHKIFSLSQSFRQPAKSGIFVGVLSCNHFLRKETNNKARGVSILKF